MRPPFKPIVFGQRAKDSGAAGFATLKTTLTILQATSDAIPLPGLKGAIGGLLAIISAAEKTSQNVTGVDELCSHSKGLTDTLDEVIRTQESDITESLKKRVEKLSSEIIDIANESKKISSHSQLRRFLGSTDDARVLGDLNRKMKQSLDKFLLEGAINTETQIENTRQNVIKTRDGVSGLHVHMTDQRQSDVLHRLRRAPARYNADLRNSASECLMGTRVEILQKIDSWIEDKDPSSPRIFYLSGLAGTGKSTIAQTVSERCHQRGYLGASFFFSRDETNCSNSLLVFSTIAYQLAVFKSSFKLSIARALEADSDIGSANIRTQLQKLIIEPLQSVVAAPSPVVVVMDALDECSQESGASDILRLLAIEIGKLPFLLKFFITSRPELHIRSNFASPAMRSVSQSFILHDIESSVVQNDIERFLRHRFAEVATNLFNGASWVTEDDLKALVDKSSGLFIFASTAANFIENKYYGDPKGQLQALLQVKTASGSSPYRDLDKLYLKVLGGAVPEGADKSLRDRFQSVLGAIIVLLDPLPPPALERLLNVQSESVKVTLAHLHSVIVLPKVDDQAIRLIHPSFSDFLTHPDRCSDQRLFINPKEHHGRLTLHCFNRMMSSLKRDICDIKDFSKLNSELGDLTERLAHVAPPELRYASFHWASHLSQSPQTDSSQLDHMRSFCFDHLLHWLELLSLLGRLDVVMPSLKLARSWLMEVSHPHEELTELLNDTQRLVLEFYEPISMSALHIYYSALPFTPPRTLIFRTFYHELKYSVKVIVGLDEGWNPCLRALEGHSDSVASATFSPDGACIASGSDDMTIRLWDSSTGVILTTLKGHLLRVRSVAFSPDGTHIVSGSSDKTIRVWDISTGVQLAIINGHTSLVRSVAFSPDGSCIASGSEDKTVCIWDSTTGAALSTLEGHLARVRSIAFSPDGDNVVSGSDDMTLRLWNSSKATVFTPLDGLLGRVRSVAFSPDGTHIVSGSSDNSIRLWDAMSGVVTATFNGHSGIVRSVAFSPDGTQIVSGSEDKSLQLWNSSTGAVLATLEGHSSSVRSVAFSPDGTRIVSGSDDRTVRLWDSLTRTAHVPLQSSSPPVHDSHSGWVTSVAFSPDGKHIISGSVDRTVRLWDSLTGAVQATLSGHSGVVRSVAFSPDGTQIASGSEDKTVIVWDSSTGAVVITLNGHLGWVRTVAFSPDGAYIASGSEDNTIKLWNLSTGEALTTIHGHSGIVWSVAFSPDGTHIVSGSEDKTVCVWDAASGASIASGTGHSGWVTSVAFSPDGKQIISGSSDNSIQVWDASTWKVLTILQGHSDWVRSVAFSPDGTQIVSGSEDKTVRLWDSSTGAVQAILNVHLGKVRSVAFSSDGRQIVSGSEDKTVRVWDSSAGVVLATMGGSSSVKSVAISQDGTHIVSGSSDGTVKLWDSWTGEVLATLEAHSCLVQSVGFSLDGMCIVCAFDDKSEQYWDLLTRAAVDTLPEQKWIKSGLVSRESYKLDGEWIMGTMQGQMQRRLCWVPLPCRGVAASHGVHHVMGSTQGRVTILDFSALGPT